MRQLTNLCLFARLLTLFLGGIFMRLFRLFAVAMLATTLWAGNVAAQGCPPPPPPGGDDGFVPEYVDPARQDAMFSFMMACMEYNTSQTHHEGQVEQLAMLYSALEFADEQGLLTAAEYQAILDLLDTAQADLIISGATLDTISDRLDDAWAAIGSSAGEYWDEDYEDAYGDAIMGVGFADAYDALSASLDNCAESADTNMLDAVALLMGVVGPPPPARPPRPPRVAPPPAPMRPEG